jgi:hypothetical protein
MAAVLSWSECAWNALRFALTVITIGERIGPKINEPTRETSLRFYPFTR